MSKKIKILTYNKAGFDKAVKHAFSLGVTTRDGKLTYDANKSAIVITVDGGKATMAKSRAGYTPKKDPYAAIMDLAAFRAANHVNELIANRPVVSGVSPAECESKTKTAHAQGYAIGEEVGYAVGYIDGTEDAAPQTTLKCVEATVLTQNPIVWASMGVPYFKENGVDIVEADGKLWTIDTVANTSTEFTAASVAEQVKKDLLAGDDTVYTSFAKNFELIDSIRYEKVLVTEDSED